MNRWNGVRSPGSGFAQLAIALLLMSGPVIAQQASDEASNDIDWSAFADNQYYKIHLNMRFRIELWNRGCESALWLHLGRQAHLCRQG